MRCTPLVPGAQARAVESRLRCLSPVLVFCQPLAGVLDGPGDDPLRLGLGLQGADPVRCKMVLIHLFPSGNRVRVRVTYPDADALLLECRGLEARQSLRACLSLTPFGATHAA